MIQQPQQQTKPPVGKPPIQMMKDADTKSIVSTSTSQSRPKRQSSSRDRSHLLKSDILSKEEEARIAREKREKLEEVRKKYTKRSCSRGSQKRDGSGSESEARTASTKTKQEGLRKISPSGGTTIGTREEDLNIEEFMRADMHEINKEEDKLQREIMNIHLKNLAKHAQVVNKYKIDVTIKNTEELVRKILNLQTQTQAERTKLHEKPPVRKPEVVDEDMLS
jgi:succinate dehydrogenase flavin-adding protein (antitoxin of CptAB toxin-antitoxin module)